MKLKTFLDNISNQVIATNKGTIVHEKMQNIVIDDMVGEHGDKEIIEEIKKRPLLMPYFTKDAKTEIPIAGYLNNIFVSRRIDRLLLNHETKEIIFIDYKTDTDKTSFIDKYKEQLNEYRELLASAYPNYKISGYILWLHDWTFDKII